MRQIDFEHGGIAQNILKAALPMLVAQVLNLLYNIVDRIYIARIPDIGTAALGAVGLCFPIIVIITAFSNLFGSGGAPLFAIARGSGDKAPCRADFEPGLHAVVVLRRCIDGHWPAVCPAHSGLIRCFAGSIAVCAAVPDAVLAGHLPFHAHNRAEPVHQCAGLCHSRYAQRGDRRSGQPGAGPGVYLCVGHGHPRRGGCHGAFAAAFGGVCGVFPALQVGIPRAAAALASAARQQALHRRYRQPWHSGLHHAADQQRGDDLLQQCAFRDRAAMCTSRS